MSKSTKPAIWIVSFLLMCWVIYQLLGWLGVLFLAAAGALGGFASVFINRKVMRDEHIARFRSESDRFNQ